MHFTEHLSNQIPLPYRKMGAPACPACPGQPWSVPSGLAIETWDPPSKGLPGNTSHRSGVLVEREIYLTPLSGSQTPCSLRT